ncbi:MAG: leucyl aminopeptidase [Alphaproteobacteria bacterium]|nr:leucyl aminopeptidase [Alphaproteobacteria bacterium]
MKVSFAVPALPRSGALALTVSKGGTLEGLAAEADSASSGALSRAITASRFDGTARTTLEVTAPAGLDAERVLLVGVGDELDSRLAEDIGGTVYSALAKSGSEAAVFAWPQAGSGAAAGLGAALAAYRFDKYRTQLKDKDKPTLAALALAVPDADAAARSYEEDGAQVVEAVAFARDFVSEPGNVLYPETYAEGLRDLEAVGVSVEVLDRAALEELKMATLLGVAQGSTREARVVVMRWQGSDGPPIALVGKGVTFDTGGISIKPAGGMEEMKWDMGGSAAVAGAMRAVAGRKAAANVVGIVGLVENMPSATAQRPGDVVTSYSGQTVEVINTDAEGRLVLADLLAYVIERYEPRAVVDLATLTGAMVMALAHEYAGMFSNDEALAKALLAAGDAVDEKLWRFPLHDAYDKMLESPIADMRNIGSSREAGAITAAQFLKRFVGETAWAHLDIAGTAWTDKARPTVPKGATGYGVRLLDRLVRDVCES